LNRGSRNELQEYFDSGKLSTLDFLLILIPTLQEPLRRNCASSGRRWSTAFQHLQVASLARDIFSISAIAVGVEQLFNSARDICYYRRGSLSSTTIQDLIIFRCSSKFDIEEEEDNIEGYDLTLDDKQVETTPG